MTDQEASAISLYLRRYATDLVESVALGSTNPDVIVIIPCHDEPDLITSLNSLHNCTIQGFQVAVIVVINASEGAKNEVKERNLRNYKSALVWASKQKNGSIDYSFILNNELPRKHAGVGLARKLGMDTALHHFHNQKKNGILLCFDADSQCASNYLQEVYNFFSEHPSMPGCSIHFEHPLEGDLPIENYKGIASYELHLRYYIDALRFAGYPHAYQTIGSSMAVRAHIYAQQGGMNRRKAGEDFYFLHKIISLGNFGELKSTTVIPSSRQSHRVPFGTGKAIGDWINKDMSNLMTYNPKTFEDLRLFLNKIKNWDYQILPGQEFYENLPLSVQTFLQQIDFDHSFKKILKNAAHQSGFLKGFFQWFDGLRVLKYVHFARDEYYPDVPVDFAAEWLFAKLNILSEDGEKDKVVQLLQSMRDFDRI